MGRNSVSVVPESQNQRAVDAMTFYVNNGIFPVGSVVPVLNDDSSIKYSKASKKTAAAGINGNGKL